MADNIYIFDKKSPYTKRLLGEIQTNFNMSFVLDGTKDTSKVIVASYSESKEIEANTIVLHENTNTWWIVGRDKVERHINEKGYFYIHEISLNGAKELLNARDLTDCGFNQNRYTIEDFITRLFALSNFEFNIGILQNNAIHLSNKVDYIKTYQNYTLLSALRDFLDGYNCSFNLEFRLHIDGTKIAYAIVNITSKTGNQNKLLEENYFNDVREIKILDKDNSGTQVVSNAENVVSTREKTYPVVGSVKLNGLNFKIQPENAVLRLPSKVFKANWLKLFGTLTFTLTTISGADNWEDTLFYVPYGTSIEKFINSMVLLVDSHIGSYLPGFIALVRSNLENRSEELETAFNKCGVTTIYDGNIVDPTYNNGNGRLEKGDNVPYLAKLGDGLVENPLTLIEKTERNILPLQYEGIYWERGSNIIGGFDFLGEGMTQIDDLINTDYRQSATTFFAFGEGTAYVRLDFSLLIFNARTLSCIVNYIPMSDLKIKIDNQRDKNDIQLYNQNGKLTDSRALSKLLNSYAKEISSDAITKYYSGYDFSQIAKVGQKFLINNEIYVVNNLSVDFYQNENGYLLECEYTMSKQFAVKSAMVNPNTNIRDYGIPQNFNVERKQVYRDYIEFTYEADQNADNSPYISDYNDIMNFSNYPRNSCDFVAVIKCGYSTSVGGSFYWYYQLEPTKYELDKMVYIALTFNDNNIIGYGSQNVYSGFVPSRLLTNWIDTINTPISYVDDNGEVESINIAFVNNETIISIYDNYEIDVIGMDTGKSLYNMSVFVPEYIYNNAYSSSQLRIEEDNYKKDALEVPFFEYACQIGDSEDVLIGDNILAQDDDCVYLYSIAIKDKYSATPKNATTSSLPVYDNVNHIWSVVDSCEFSFDLYMGQRLIINLYSSSAYNRTNNEIIDIGQGSATANKDICVFRHKISKTGVSCETECIMVLRNIKDDNLYAGGITLFLNQYRLK